MTLFKRIFAEKRAIVLPLGIAIIVNIGIYALVVHPLEAKSAGTGDRATAAANALTAAERDAAAGQALVTGKTRADEELRTFYDKVIPADYPTARRMTQALVPALAQKANVKYESARYERGPVEKDSRLGLLKIRIVLQGNYENVRRFIYALETAPEFVIIDDVSLAQNDLSKPLSLTLGLSTYYRLDVNGR
jgi:type II secretion system (T2SS) protein M